MGLIKEPLDVDFYVDPRPMTKEDQKAVSDYIKADKLRRSKMIKDHRKSAKLKVSKARQKQKA